MPRSLQLAQSALETGEDSATDADAVFAQAYRLLGVLAAQALLPGPAETRLPAQLVEGGGVEVEVVRRSVGLERLQYQQVRERLDRFCRRGDFWRKAKGRKHTVGGRTHIADHAPNGRASLAQVFGKGVDAVAHLAHHVEGLVILGNHLVDALPGRIDGAHRALQAFADFRADPWQGFEFAGRLLAWPTAWFIGSSMASARRRPSSPALTSACKPACNCSR